MKDKNTFREILTSLLVLCFYGIPCAAISLSGTIIDLKGGPVEGASVKLARNGTSATSGKDGCFSLTDNAIHFIPYQQTGIPRISISNDVIAIDPVLNNQRLHVSLCDFRGRVVYDKSIQHSRGISIPLNELARGAMVLHFSEPSRYSLIVYHAPGSNRYTVSKKPATNYASTDRGSTGDSDTLIIAAPGFGARRIPVDNMTGKGYRIPLAPAIVVPPSGPRIFYCNYHLANSLVFADIFSMKSDGSDQRQVTGFSSVFVNVAGPKICADGTHLTFSSNLNTSASAFYYDIFSLDLRSGGLHRITGDERPWIPHKTAPLTVTIIDKGLAISPSRFRVSAKGTFGFVFAESGGAENVYTAQLVVPADEKIWVKAEKAKGQGALEFITVPSGTNGTITLDITKGGTFSADMAGPSPNTADVAVSTVYSQWDFDKNRELPFFGVDVWSSATGVKLFEQLGAEPHQGGDRDAVYSPDGSIIALVSGPYTLTSLITVPSTSPHTPKQLAQGFNDVLGTVTGILAAHVSCTAPCFSPDGKTIVFCYFILTPNSDLHSKLYRIPADGSSAAVAISNNPVNTLISSPGFSPDGSQLVFSMITSKNATLNVTDLAQLNYTCDIYVMASAGGTYSKITVDGASSDPSWGTVP